METKLILCIAVCIHLSIHFTNAEDILNNDLDDTIQTNDSKDVTTINANITMETEIPADVLNITTIDEIDKDIHNDTLQNLTNENENLEIKTEKQLYFTTEYITEKKATTSTDHSITTPILTAIDKDDDIIRCDDHDMITSCDVTHFERCVLIRERAPRCVCLSGFSRDKSSRCIASKHYRASLLTLLDYNSDLQNVHGAKYRKLVYEAKEGILAATEQSRLSAVYIDIDIITISRGISSEKLAIEFALLLPRHYAPEELTVERDIKEGITQVLTPGDWQGVEVAFLAETSIPVLEENMAQLTVKAPDPCSDPLLNYCHQDAICHVTTSWGFTCLCNHGYQDQSPYPQEAPGEICTLTCECKNGGECLIGEADSEIVCSCPSWYLGEKCEIDGKVLFIALCIIICCFIVIALVICCVCLRRMRNHQEREKKTLDAAITRDFPTVVTNKAPSSWLDHWQYNSEPLPPEEHTTLPCQDSSCHSSSGTFPRGYLSIPRPHVRSTLGHNTIDTIRHPKTREKWVWPET